MSEKTVRNASSAVIAIHNLSTRMHMHANKYPKCDFEFAAGLVRQVLGLTKDCVTFGIKPLELNPLRPPQLKLCEQFPGLYFHGKLMIRNMLRRKTDKRAWWFDIYHPDVDVQKKIYEHVTRETSKKYTSKFYEDGDYVWIHNRIRMTRTLQESYYTFGSGYSLNPFSVIHEALGIYASYNSSLAITSDDKLIVYPGMSLKPVQDREKKFHKLADELASKYNGVIKYRNNWGHTIKITKQYAQRLAKDFEAISKTPIVVSRIFKTNSEPAKKLEALIKQFDIPIMTKHISCVDGLVTSTKAANPREAYGEYYDGWRIGNRELEVALWLAYKRPPFNVFPRDIMNILVARVLVFDAVMKLERIFGMPLWDI